MKVDRIKKSKNKGMAQILNWQMRSNRSGKLINFIQWIFDLDEMNIIQISNTLQKHQHNETLPEKNKQDFTSKETII